MTRFVPIALALLVFCWGVVPAPSAAGPYDDLLKLVPPSSNAIILANVKEAHASPLGQAQKWGEQFRASYRSGIGSIPPNAELVVAAADVRVGLSLKKAFIFATSG